MNVTVSIRFVHARCLFVSLPILNNECLYRLRAFLSHWCLCVFCLCVCWLAFINRVFQFSSSCPLDVMLCLPLGVFVKLVESIVKTILVYAPCAMNGWKWKQTKKNFLSSLPLVSLCREELFNNTFTVWGFILYFSVSRSECQLILHLLLPFKSYIVHNFL